MQPSNEVFEHPREPESSRIVTALRNETTGGMLLIITAVAALIWANSDWSSSYQNFINFTFGPESINLNLSVAKWASDFLLAFFFFIIGIELKHEFVHGSLSNIRQATVPMVAAVFGMVVPAGIFLAFNTGTPAQSAWAIPIATDVAFALAILAVAGRKLPLELRSFLLTVAVVDDLIAIVVIAVFYGHGISFSYLLASMVLIALFGLVQHKGYTNVWLALLIAFCAWYAMLQSGIHATIAGVALGLVMNVSKGENQKISSAAKSESVLRPFSAGVCVPLFSLTTIGVAIEQTDFHSIVTSPLALGIMMGFILGKPVGVTLGAYVTARFTKARLNPSLSWGDVFAVGTLASIGFTVALLITEISFFGQEEPLNVAKFGIIVSNVLAIVVAVTVLRFRKSRLG